LETMPIVAQVTLRPTPISGKVHTSLESPKSERRVAANRFEFLAETGIGEQRFGKRVLPVSVNAFLPTTGFCFFLTLTLANVRFKSGISHRSCREMARHMRPAPSALDAWEVSL
jgi:hypothetical protein